MSYPAAEQCLRHFTSCFDSRRFLGNIAFRIFHTENDSTDSPPSPTPEAERRRFLDRLDSKGVGLGIVRALMEDNSVDSEPNPRILFGFHIKTDYSPPLLSPSEWPETLSDSETESRVGTWGPPRVIISSLSVREMVMSEEYTRVTVHGPIPRVTHIYSNCIVHNSLFEDESSDSSESSQEVDQPVYPSDTFLSICFFCKKSIGLQDDIFMLRGERAFCSAQCRYAGRLMADKLDFVKVAAVKKSELLSVAAEGQS